MPATFADVVGPAAACCARAAEGACATAMAAGDVIASAAAAMNEIHLIFNVGLLVGGSSWKLSGRTVSWQVNV
jgi:hypothetical protein